MGKLFPAIYDAAMKGFEENAFKVIRNDLIQKATGKVIEIGSGSGINFPLYTRAESVDAIEPNPYMIKRTKSRLEKAKVPIQSHMLGAEKLSFPDNSFDTVVATLVFCTIPEPNRALDEIKRVAKPGARFLVFEHVRMNHPGMAKAQELLNPVWKRICDGCHLDRDTLSLLKEHEIHIDHVHSYYKGLFLTVEGTIIK
ncbi:methyltransferase type 11 [Bacillus sp. FJAT-18017]|uniref:class I SAM-dependent methyltransferase n=1 Tax=Bacillus sp. FJAT-18017 TaxID=1705566 RepID=UPI0006AF9EC3|nr:class I SAM-dependent methyltransferase [Bacillus sp. FJAT-18017]ALC92037.1 methyltransferase type 11 [Bacillus sp. FJAT-18017]